MLAAIQPIELPIKAYAVALTGMMTAAFMTGAVLNFQHARNNPGADPYARPVIEAVTAPEALPVTTAPVQPVAPPTVVQPTDDERGAALVAHRQGARPVVARRQPTYCTDQVAADGTLLGKLCQEDPGGVKGSAIGAAPAGAVAR